MLASKVENFLNLWIFWSFYFDFLIPQYITIDLSNFNKIRSRLIFVVTGQLTEKWEHSVPKSTPSVSRSYSAKIGDIFSSDYPSNTIFQQLEQRFSLRVTVQKISRTDIILRQHFEKGQKWQGISWTQNLNDLTDLGVKRLILTGLKRAFQRAFIR